LNELSRKLQDSIDAVNRAKDEAAYSVVNLGKRLCELKGACEHGTFAQIAKDSCGLKQSQCKNLMQVYRTFGQNANQLAFSSTVLIELSKAPDPQKALDTADETITVKEAKEMVAKAKKEALQKDLSNLKPLLKKMLDDGLLEKAVAEEFSGLPDKAQVAIAKTYLEKTKEFERAERDRLSLVVEKRKVADANERAMTAISEKEQAVSTARELGGKEATERIKELKDTLHNLKITMAAEIKEETRAFVQKEVRAEQKEKTEKEREHREKLERDLARLRECNKGLGEENLFERTRAERVEAELAAHSTIEKESKHAQTLMHIVADVSAVLEKVSNECETTAMVENQLVKLAGIVDTYLDSKPQIIDMV